MTDEVRDRKWLWFAIFVGPLAWSMDFALSYGLTGRACTVQSAGLLLVFSALALGATVTGLLAAVRATRQLERADTAAEPARFMAISGVVISGGFLLAIMAAALPRLMVHPCV
jgi:hypothetical protein